ncbi:AbrB/MazE/SpoVT family DNA-binding domain-containing protein [Variovorax sp. KBS0712]|uniref:AbrB/MazE/SpoVT family DNA-binding domain-containing protein n=1 Tax=Variovorax sp. KBS0712 TaxID=2578111 RepID=UPI001118D1D8|nr:AbrB/MazE/SpoVT family DNA-binding domain-containing protein [Variovorax sp. KBS0712]TSD53356.1 AbrB/MazE/SpoVT family DNA-binding domain-containing protein [Variovorax sp. KBS0712]
MTTVTVSSKFQVVIPQAIREQMAIEPGARFSVVRHGKAIELIPVPTLEELQAELRGIPTDIVDDPERF